MNAFSKPTPMFLWFLSNKNIVLIVEQSFPNKVSIFGDSLQLTHLFLEMFDLCLHFSIQIIDILTYCINLKKIFVSPMGSLLTECALLFMHGTATGGLLCILIFFLQILNKELLRMKKKKIASGTMVFITKRQLNEEP